MTVTISPARALAHAVTPAAPSVPQRRRQVARQRFPAREHGHDWASTSNSRGQVLDLLNSAPFILDNAGSQQVRYTGLVMLLDWLSDQPGHTWQERWQTTGVETAGATWREQVTEWLRAHGLHAGWRTKALGGSLAVMIAADVVRPSVTWLVCESTGRGSLVRNMSACRDRDGFARLRELCDSTDIRPMDGKLALHRGAVILAAKGGLLHDIGVGDVLELLEAEAAAHVQITSGTSAFYTLLQRMGALGIDAPESLREARAMGQRTVDELIDRYQLACRPIRDLLVEYLRERQPALDYVSLASLAHYLGNSFWADIERHHPGIDTLRLPADVAMAWKQRLRTKTTTVTAADGRKTEISVERIAYRECLTPVRALYLDLAQWALHDPARWGPWVAPSPVGAEEVNRRKAFRQRKARMDARTRERLPVLPILVRTVSQRRADTEALLRAAERSEPGQSFNAAGQTLMRAAYGTAGKTWATEPDTGKRRDLGVEEEQAFWAWAAVEVLHATGIRIEELLELNHHSLIRYRLPTTGEVVPLLQIAPSKMDAERLLVVSPELADVLSTIICRVRDDSGVVPLVRAYDYHECVWLPPAPLLFQRRQGTNKHSLSPNYIRSVLTAALNHTGLTDPASGNPLHCTPHDFRRLFITDAILNGLPPHIAQVIAGHSDINVTLGYKAVYPGEAIQAHLAFLARRRELRPSEEYRTPTDEEWQEFLGHFERRKVSIGTCARAFSTPCIHEHACVRCSMLWPDPAQRARLEEIRDNLTARIVEAEREGWHGEVEGLRISLAGAENKLAQMIRRSAGQVQVQLGMPGARPVPA